MKSNYYTDLRILGQRKGGGDTGGGDTGGGDSGSGGGDSGSGGGAEEGVPPGVRP